jgi:hypothetical protein
MHSEQIVTSVGLENHELDALRKVRRVFSRISANELTKISQKSEAYVKAFKNMFIYNG